jgi:hypothetical protein
MKVTTPFSPARTHEEDHAILGKLWETPDALIMVLVPVLSKHIPEEKGFARGEGVVAWYVQPDPTSAADKLRAVSFNDYQTAEDVGDEIYKSFAEDLVKLKETERTVFADAWATAQEEAELADDTVYPEGVTFKLCEGALVNAVLQIAGVQVSNTDALMEEMKNAMTAVCTPSGPGNKLTYKFEKEKGMMKPVPPLDEQGVKAWQFLQKTSFTFISHYPEIKSSLADMKLILWDRFVERRNAIGQAAREIEQIDETTKILHVMGMKTPANIARKMKTDDRVFYGKIYETERSLCMILLPVCAKAVPRQKGFYRGEGIVAWYVESLGPETVRATYFTDYSVVDPSTNQRYKEMTPKVLQQYMKTAIKGKSREKRMFEEAAIIKE